MSRPSRIRPAGDAWCWRRRVAAVQEDLWIGRLGDAAWSLTGRPEAKRPLLSVYAQTRAQVEPLRRAWGGKIEIVRAKQWSKPSRFPPLRIGGVLEIVHEKSAPRSIPHLHIPLGLAFGSGEHVTTAMLLRALARRGDLGPTRVLDLGTGSGILALAARRLGARRIVATDFDADAIRTARQNEALNFREPLVRWRCADVKRLGVTSRYDLVLANLFSGILCEAAAAIAAAVAPGGQLWLSGILREQEGAVIAAYRRRGLLLFRAARRGKWVLLQWRR